MSRLGRGLTHESRDEAVEADPKQRKTEFARQDRRGKRLPGARRAHEHELASRRKTVIQDSPGMALLTNDTFDPIREGLSKDHVPQP